MKKMKIVYALAITAFLVMLSTSFVGATLDISVAVADPQINQGQSQVITATTNEGGKGILLVLQPALGDPWAGFLMTHPALAALWASLPSDIKTQVQEKIGDKIVSYKLIAMEKGDSVIATFPEDFKGINGDPSTALQGEYKVIFVFLAKCESDDQVPDGGNTLDAAIECKPHRECRFVELDFAAAGWFVVPEVPLGTIAPILASFVALPVAKLYRRKHA
jgi:hypothetical protein